jgi:hypothetical protein
VPDVVLGAELAVALELLVEAAQRGPLIPRNEGARVQAAAAVGTVLVEEDPHQALYARQKDASLLEQVPVRERDLAPNSPPATLHRGPTPAVGTDRPAAIGTPA